MIAPVEATLLMGVKDPLMCGVLPKRLSEVGLMACAKAENLENLKKSIK